MTFALPEHNPIDDSVYPESVWFIVDKDSGIWRISVAYRSKAEAERQIGIWSNNKQIKDTSNMEARRVGIQDWSRF